MGDYLESDPYCAYVPRRYAKLVGRGQAEEVSAYFDHRIEAHMNRGVGLPKA